MGLEDHALTFTIELDKQNVIIMIQNPTDIVQIVTESMKLSTNLYNQYLWTMHPPSLMLNHQVPIIISTIDSSIPSFYQSLNSMELPFYPQQQ